MCDKFKIKEKEQKALKEWLLSDTTLDRTVFLKEEKLQEVYEEYQKLKKQYEEEMRKQEGGSNK